MIIAERSVREIVAYVSGPGQSPLENTRVLVARRSDPTKVAESVITRVGPTIEEMPPRLWIRPSVPRHGRAIVIEGVPSLQLTPGEQVTVRLLDR